MRYYVDTCIWRDYFENRNDGTRPLGEWAFSFIKKTIMERSAIIVSDIVIRELKGGYPEKIVAQIIHGVMESLNTHQVFANTRQTREARVVSRERALPTNDALHAILARDNDAILITRDKHFKKVADYCKIHLPEDLL